MPRQEARHVAEPEAPDEAHSIGTSTQAFETSQLTTKHYQVIFINYRATLAQLCILIISFSRLQLYDFAPFLEAILKSGDPEYPHII